MNDSAIYVFENITRPIIGIENRTAQEVFEIMVGRFKAAESSTWFPIETCPKNTSVILQCWWKTEKLFPFVFEGYLDWDGETWHKAGGELIGDELYTPVYWRALPVAAPVSYTASRDEK